MKEKTFYCLKLTLAFVIIFAITYWYLSYYRNMLYSFSADEGIFLYGAKRVLDGQIIYRDFFSYFFPGNYYLLALIYKLFGYSFLTARETLVIIDCLINVLVFYLSYKVLKAWYAIIPPLFFLVLGFPNWMQFSHFWTSDLFLMLSLVTLLWYLEKNKEYYFSISALLLGLTALFQQATGVYGVLICMVVLFLRRHSIAIKESPHPTLPPKGEGILRPPRPFGEGGVPTRQGRVVRAFPFHFTNKLQYENIAMQKEDRFFRSLVWFYVCFSLPLAVMFGYIALQGGLSDFIRQQLFVVLKVYPNVAAFSPFLFIFNKAYPFNILIGIYFFGSIAAGIILLAVYKKLSNPVIVAIAGNLILLLTISYSLDVEHIATAMPLFLILVLLPVKYVLSYTKAHVQSFYKPLYYLSGIAGICLLTWGGSSILSNVRRIQTQSYALDIDGTRVWTFDELKVNRIESFIHNVPSILQDHRNVFVYPYAPLLYVFLGLNNPTHYDFIYIRLGIEGANSYVLDDIINELQQKHVTYLIKHGWPEHYTHMLMSLKHITPYPNILDEFVQSHYTQLWTIGDYGILRIKPFSEGHSLRQ